MTLKEEAKELVYKYSHLVTSWDCYWDTEIPIENRMEQMKECALIAIDFAMNSKYSFQPMHGGWVSGKLYYEEVKQEIENL